MEQTSLFSPQTATGRISDKIFPVANGITGMEIVFVNVFFIQDGDGWVLVDAGLYGSANRIRKAAEQQFGKNKPPKAILLTHGHFDHVGALKELASYWDVPVYAHHMELPYITGLSSYPPPDPSVGRGAMAFMSWMYPKKPIHMHEAVQELPADGSVPGLPDWKWIETPGHTPGHVSFFRERDRTLIVGDAFVTRHGESALAVLTQKKEIHGPPAYFTPDWIAAKRSVELLAALQPEVAAAGHGMPMKGVVLREELNDLARHFEEKAVPKHGRYVNRPAVADENGVISVPPPLGSAVPKVLIAAGIVSIAGLAIYAFTRQNRKKKLNLRGPSVRDTTYYAEESTETGYFPEDEYYYKEDSDPLGNPRGMSNNYP